jgi:hypothetical protein
VIFGETGSESVELIVRSIEPQNDLTAKITCVDAAPAIHMADAGIIPAFASQVTLPPELQRPPVPVLSSIQSDEEVLIRNPDGSFTPAIVVTVAPHGFSLPLALSAQLRAEGETDFARAQVIVNENQLTILSVESGSYYDIKIIYNNSTGIASPELLIPNYLVVGDTGLPSDVTGFNISTLGAAAHLSWDPVPDPDLGYYRIKFSKAMSGVSWSNALDLIARVGRPATTVTVPAASGTYLIKAVDAGGRESGNEALVISDIDATATYSDAVSITEDTSWPGGGLDFDVVGPTLRIAIDGGTGTYLPEATYYIDALIDLEAVYAATLTAEIGAIGATLGSSMDLFGNVDAIGDWDDTAGPSDWSVKLQVSTTNDDPASITAAWTPMKDFVIGEYTARAFSFYAVLASAQPTVTPVVSGISITAKLPGIVQADDDVSAASTDAPATTVTFPQSFHLKPAIAITAQGLSTGDYFNITHASPNGFKIAFKNSGGTRVTRTFDYVAKGHGMCDGNYGFETRLLLANMTTEPDAARRYLIDETIKALKDAGIWSKLDMLYMLAAHDSQAARLNWLNPAGPALSAVNSPTFTTDRGYAGNGTSSYLNTSLSPNTFDHLRRDSAHLGFWQVTNASTNSNDIGIFGDANTRLRNYNSGSSLAGRLHDATTGIFTTSSSTGHAVINRSAASARQFYQSGTSVGTDSVTSTAGPSGSSLNLLRADASYTADQLAAAHAGASLSSTEVANLYTILRDYLQELGAA